MNLKIYAIYFNHLFAIHLQEKKIDIQQLFVILLNQAHLTQDTSIIDKS